MDRKSSYPRKDSYGDVKVTVRKAGRAAKETAAAQVSGSHIVSCDCEESHGSGAGNMHSRDTAFTSGGPQRTRPQDQVRWNQNYSTQDVFLGDCIESGRPVKLFLKNNSSYLARINSYDNWSLNVTIDGFENLIFKSNIMAIRKPHKPHSSEDCSTAGSRQILSDFCSEYAHDPA